MSISELEKLVTKIKHGDKQAEQVLFKQFFPRIELIVRTRLPHNMAPGDVQDIVNDVLFSLLDSLRKGNFDSSRNLTLSTYTVGIAQNQIALYFRKLRRNREFTQDELPEVQDETQSHLDRMIARETREKLRRKLASFKPLHQKVLLLRYYEHKSISDICESVGLERKQVIDLIHYATKTLVKKCQKDDYFSISGLLLQIFMWFNWG